MLITPLLLASSLLMMGGCSSNDDPVQPEVPPTPTEPATSMVLYEANPRFFASNGSLQVINSRLDNIQQMGTTVLWLMPICEPGVVNSVGSPYCIKDFKAVNSRYGSLADLQTLVNNAHNRGMRVILDWVANHTAWDHEWITAHPDWYAQDANGNIISPPGQNWNDVAELNYDNQQMRAAMIDAMKYWVTTAGVDGFRCDYTDGVPHDFWKEAIAQLRAAKSDLLMLSESEGVSYFDDGFDMMYDWSYASLIGRLFNGRTTINDFYDAAADLLAAVPEGKQVMRYVVNHDVAMSSNLGSLYGSVDAIIPAYVLTAMLDGVPLLYSSMETQLPQGTLSFFNYQPLTWDSSLEATYAQINSIYAATAEVRGGELRTYATGDVATFARTTADHSMLVMVNITPDQATVRVPMAYSGKQMQNMLTGQTAALPASVSLGRYEYVIYFE